MGLRNLRRIGVQEVDLCVGQEELDWMKRRWRLKVWTGLKPFVSHDVEVSDAQKGDDGYYSNKNILLLRMIKDSWPSISRAELLAPF